MPQRGEPDANGRFQPIRPPAGEVVKVGFGSTPVIAFGTTPLVGRDEELDLLLRRGQQAKLGEGRVVLVSGEPGIGKSRLTSAGQSTVYKRAGSAV